jgi:hypothetical protein
MAASRSASVIGLAVGAVGGVEVQLQQTPERKRALRRSLPDDLAEPVRGLPRALGVAPANQDVVRAGAKGIVHRADHISLTTGVACVEADEEVVVEPRDQPVVVKVPEQDGVPALRRLAFELRVGPGGQPDAGRLGDGLLDGAGCLLPRWVVGMADDCSGLSILDQHRLERERHELVGLDLQALEQSLLCR